MTFRTEFPDFDPATMPVIPAGFQDMSWHNDVCPSFVSNTLKLRIWVDYVDIALREYGQPYRFTVETTEPDKGNDEIVLRTSGWHDVLTFISQA